MDGKRELWEAGEMAGRTAEETGPAEGEARVTAEKTEPAEGEAGMTAEETGLEAGEAGMTAEETGSAAGEAEPGGEMASASVENIESETDKTTNIVRLGKGAGTGAGAEMSGQADMGMSEPGKGVECGVSDGPEREPEEEAADRSGAESEPAETQTAQSVAQEEPVQWSYGQVVPPHYDQSMPSGYGQSVSQPGHGQSASSYYVNGAVPPLGCANAVPPQNPGYGQASSSGYGNTVPPQQPLYSQGVSSGYVNDATRQPGCGPTPSSGYVNAEQISSYSQSASSGYVNVSPPQQPLYSQGASSGYVNAERLQQSSYSQGISPGYVNVLPPQQPLYSQGVSSGYANDMSRQPGYEPLPSSGYVNVLPPQIPPLPPQTYSFYESRKPEQSADGLAIASMVLGMVSIVMCVWFYIAIPCAIVGLILGCVYRAKGGKNGMSIAGIACSGSGMAIGMIVLLAFLVAA